MPQDKQLHGVSLDAVVEKRRLDQALNAKEFAILAGISYSTARTWFRLPGFPVFRGVVFWQDFMYWRQTQLGRDTAAASQSANRNNHKVTTDSAMSQQAQQIMRDAGLSRA